MTAYVAFGEYFYRQYGLLGIYGKVMTKEEFSAGERSCGASREEIEYEWQTLLRGYRRGFRYGWHYSVNEPTGELGSTHITDITRTITQEEFERARIRGWQ